MAQYFFIDDVDVGIGILMWIITVITIFGNLISLKIFSTFPKNRATILFIR